MEYVQYSEWCTQRLASFISIPAHSKVLGTSLGNNKLFVAAGTEGSWFLGDPQWDGDQKRSPLYLLPMASFNYLPRSFPDLESSSCRRRLSTIVQESVL